MHLNDGKKTVYKFSPASTDASERLTDSKWAQNLKCKIMVKTGKIKLCCCFHEGRNTDLKHIVIKDFCWTGSSFGSFLLFKNKEIAKISHTYTAYGQRYLLKLLFQSKLQVLLYDSVVSKLLLLHRCF